MFVGKLADKKRVSFMGRNIPACAGKTMHTLVAETGKREHPRVCGENIGVTERSTPHLWNIPAHAGKTS